MSAPPKATIDTCLAAYRARRPDDVVEEMAVLADWAEEHGWFGLAAQLRRDDHHVQWSGLTTAMRMIDPEWLEKPIPNQVGQAAADARAERTDIIGRLERARRERRGHPISTVQK